VALLMLQLPCFSRRCLVLAGVPRGLFGVGGALLRFNRALGCGAILGVRSLAGMIARTAVLLIEQIEAERREGTDAWNAVIKGALSRFRPIMLTAISTVLGMIPIATTIFWGPMAFAIMGGLLTATLLTLIFLPALYLHAFG
jgi:multidrug efflux pump